MKQEGRKGWYLRVSTAVKRHHDSSYKGKTGWLSYNFRGSVHYHHGREHGSVQADMVQESRWESCILQTIGS